MHMRMRIAFGGVLAVLIAALPLSAPAYASDDLDDTAPPPPGTIFIDILAFGTGCAPSTRVAVSPDNTALTVDSDGLEVQVVGGTPPASVRKACTLNLLLHTPPGYTYGIAEATYRGFAHLEKGASGELRANHYFQGNSPPFQLPHPFTGPLTEDWQVTRTTPESQIVYLPCGVQRSLVLNTELRLSAGTSAPATFSFITMNDFGDGATYYRFAWRTCPG